VSKKCNYIYFNFSFSLIFGLCHNITVHIMHLYLIITNTTTIVVLFNILNGHVINIAQDSTLCKYIGAEHEHNHITDKILSFYSNLT